MPMNEADTRANLIDPTLRSRGWMEDAIRREETAGTVEIINGNPRRRSHGRTDYTLRVKVGAETQPVAVALIEAKAENKPPAHGLEQVKRYAKGLNVPFVFSSNGHLFVEYDCFTKRTTDPRPLAEFPTPAELQARYEQGKGFSLSSPAAKPLLTPYTASGESSRRYYQDAAIRAVLEKIAGGGNRVLLSLATGAGKTFIAVNLLKRIADAGQLRNALFICDRDELRTQGLGAFQNVFGSNSAEVFQEADGKNHAANARIHIATYHTLGVDTTSPFDPSFMDRHYPKNHFSHIIIDECHRSAFGKWSHILTRNSDAVQIGLTATPRQLRDITGQKPKAPGFIPSNSAAEDEQIIADNLKYFGPPVYEYDLSQGIDDGYLAACELFTFDLFHDGKIANERESVITRKELRTKQLTNAVTGQAISADDHAVRDNYNAQSLEAILVTPERVAAMAEHLFLELLNSGGPEQKTIIFCTRDSHADAVAVAMNNLYANWCAANNQTPQEPYAFKCTAAGGGKEYLAELRGGTRSHFIATTVDLLTTGVDVPCVRNIVFFKYVRSPISFYQMIGRGTRIDTATNKLMFRVFDYTNATRLFGKSFLTRLNKARERGEPTEPSPIIEVKGIDVKVQAVGHHLLVQKDGKAMPVPVQEYKARLAAQLTQEAPTLEQFRQRWINPPDRRELLDGLAKAGYSPSTLQQFEQKGEYDFFDLLAELGYHMPPLTRTARIAAFSARTDTWLGTLPPAAAHTLRALALQFARGGTEELENQHLFDLPEIQQVGGLKALQAAGDPADLVHKAKEQIFAA